MDVFAYFNQHAYGYIVIPLLIFCARILDVSIGTLRIILVARDKRGLASMLGFLEVLIWLMAISQIMQNLSSPFHYIAYASGFATGTWVGMTLERRLSMGTVMVRVMAAKDPQWLINELHSQGRRVTHLPASGYNMPITIVFTVIPRKALPEIVATIRRFDPQAFYTVEEVRPAYPQSDDTSVFDRQSWMWGPFMWFRKGK